MTKTKLLVIAMAVALVGFLFAGSASAQEAQLVANPSAVEAPGTHDFELTGTGFTVASLNFAICNTGDQDVLNSEIESDAVGTLMARCGGFGNPVSADADGTYNITAEGVDVTEDGVTFLLFELREGGEAGNVAVNIGAMEDMEELAETGVNTSLLVIIGAGIALAGVMVFGLSRRLRTV